MIQYRHCGIGWVFVFACCMACVSDHNRQIETLDTYLSIESSERYGNGALLLSRIQSLDELYRIVDFEYNQFLPIHRSISAVKMTHHCPIGSVTSVLSEGVSQNDFSEAQSGGIWEKLKLILKSPYGVYNRKDLQRAYALLRRRGAVFGEGDVAFYDLAETMMANISSRDTAQLSGRDLSEKGFINTFNHVVAQAFITTIFSERLADFIADAHERHAMPELITGVFTDEQIADLDFGPTDNYVDMINNAWGQELGRLLKKKFGIERVTKWTPELLTDYLNEIQNYFSWAYQIGFSPYDDRDEVVVRFSRKINRVMSVVPKVK